MDVGIEEVPKKPRIRVTVKKWHAVAAWKWSVREETCGICRCPFDATCPNCKIPGDDCPPLLGECTHVFHLHCIEQWINGKNDQEQTCPLCKRPWR